MPGVGNIFEQIRGSVQGEMVRVGIERNITVKCLEKTMKSITELQQKQECPNARVSELWNHVRNRKFKG